MFLIIVTIGTIIFFEYNPDLDLWLSINLYHFHHRQDLWYGQFLYVLRRINFWILYASLAFIIYRTIRLTWLKSWQKLKPYLYVLLSYFMAGVVVSDWLIKPFFKRARPGQVIDLAKRYTVPFEMGTECQKNCSFVSGEVAVATAFLSLLILIPHKYQRPVFFLMILWIITISAVRMAQIGHYLSDTVFAALFVSIAMLVLRKAFSNIPHKK